MSVHSKKRYSRISAKISSRTFENPFIDFGNPKMVFEGKKRFPSIPETLLEFQIVTNSETEKSSRDSETLEKIFSVSETFLGFRVCCYLKLSEGFRNVWKPFFTLENHFWVSDCSGTYFGRYLRIPCFLEFSILY
jgi:hypothetical protein